MLACPGVHPSPEDLAAFSRGQSERVNFDEIEAYLGLCGECCAALNHLGSDNFVAALRDAARRKLDARPTRPGRTVDLSTGKAGEEAGAGDLAVPPELAEHPRYCVSRFLGRGGMGSVWCAEHTLMERPVALKVIDPKLLSRD